jgi:hypothetical protein
LVVIAAAAIIGALGILIAGYCYPPIDMYTNTSVPTLLTALVLLALIHVALRREEFRKIGRTVAAIVFCLCSTFLILNGSLDNFPPVEIKTRVIAKAVRYGKGGGYVLTVAPSWRDGRTEENLGVSSTTFYTVGEGQLIQVAVHQGAFGLSWFSNVLPD